MIVILTRNSTKVQPVKVNLDPDIPKPGDVVTIMGFGLTEQGHLSNVLKSMDGDYITNDQCNKNISGMVEDDMMCMIGRENGSQCNGDSGSPWIIRDPESDKHENDIQVATVSW
jgi:Trypsin